MNLEKLVLAAKQEAGKSLHRHRIGAIIFDKNGVISTGYNQTRSVKSFSKQFIRWPNSIHAEVDCILKAKRDLKGKSILILRLNKRGELRLAKPCQNCCMYLDHVGIDKILYSLSDGGIKE